MTIGLVGRKVGMTRVFTDDGDTLPVTVLDVSDNRVTQIKSAENDGYSRRAGRVRQAPRDPRQQAARRPSRQGRRRSRPRAEGIPHAEAEAGELKPGGKIGVDIFKVGQKVDVQGITLGKGFAGVDQAPPLLVEPREPRQLDLAPRRPARPARTRARAACSPASAWPGHLGAKRSARSRTSRSCASTPSASCCWSRARCRARGAATSSSSRQGARRRPVAPKPSRAAGRRQAKRRRRRHGTAS